MQKAVFRFSFWFLNPYTISYLTSKQTELSAKLIISPTAEFVNDAFAVTATLHGRSKPLPYDYVLTTEKRATYCRPIIANCEFCGHGTPCPYCNIKCLFIAFQHYLFALFSPFLYELLFWSTCNK